MTARRYIRIPLRRGDLVKNVGGRTYWYVLEPQQIAPARTWCLVWSDEYDNGPRMMQVAWSGVSNGNLNYHLLKEGDE